MKGSCPTRDTAGRMRTPDEFRTPAGLLLFVLCDYGGRLHIAEPKALDWHTETIKTCCGREWPLPERTVPWDEVDVDDICKTCLRSSQVAHLKIGRKQFWSRLLH